MSNLSIGIDVGGTFTDVVVYDRTNHTSSILKVPSSPDDPGRAFMAGVEEGLQAVGGKPENIGSIIHGSTVATNAVLERRGATIGILTTKGFEDTLYIGRAKRSEMYDFFIGPETPYFLCPRRRVRGISARLDRSGEEVAPVSRDEVLAAVHELVDGEGIEALAVSLLFSFTNPVQEQQVVDLISSEFPDLVVSPSSLVDPRAREYERLVVTALDAYIRPAMSRYISKLETDLKDRGINASLQVMESHGGMIDAASIKSRAAGTLLSGLAGGAIGAAATGKLANKLDVLSFDMGGTSTDVALIPGGRALVSDEGRIETFDVRIPMVDVHTIGAGGGSIASVDVSGGLRVGPESAGADPGPAAYGQGGRNPTLTDANVVLGLLGHQGLAGGKLTLDSTKAKAAITEEVANPLGLTLEEAAAGIRRIAVAGMSAAVRLVSVSRGFDPRDFALVACGGAGPLHACDIAEELGMTEVLVPPFPGVLSAYGLLAADAQVPEWRTYLCQLFPTEMLGLRLAVTETSKKVLDRLAQGGLAQANSRVHAEVEVRYQGQAHQLVVPVDVEMDDDKLAQDIRDQFEREHRNVYGQADPDGAVVVMGLRVTATSPSENPVLRFNASTERPDTSMARVYSPRKGQFVDAAVLRRTTVRSPLEGPAVLLQADSTTFVDAGWIATPDDSGSITLARQQSS